MDGLKKLFTGCLTIPNLLSLIRIILIPVFGVLFYRGEMLWAVIILVLSGLTDLFDGKIARKFNQVSALGKVLDPVADKLSQLSIAIVLFIQFNQSSVQELRFFSYVFLGFLGKELLMLIVGGIMLALGLRPSAAEIFGKLATVIFYVFMIILICFAPEVGAFTNLWTMPNKLVMVLVIISLIATIVAFISYIPDTWQKLKSRKKGEIK